MRETETYIWHRLLGGLPKGTIVKIRNRAYLRGYYLGKVICFTKGRGLRFFYEIEQYPDSDGCYMWVKPESILEVLEKS